MKLVIQLSTGEILTRVRGGFTPMTPEIQERMANWMRIASDAAEDRQTVPPNMMVVYDVGAELGFWKYLERVPPRERPGRVY